MGMISEIIYIPEAGTHKTRAVRLKKALANCDYRWIKKGAVIGIKLHWGEPGNNCFLPPDYARVVAEWLIGREAKPFIFDTTTLYRGARRTALDSLFTAHKHGFDFANTGAPVVIADGFYGRDTISIPTPKNAKHLKKVQVASLVNHIDGLINLSHFKGHIASGFGGAMKNISMGFASRATKQVIHANVSPKLKREKCTSCGTCIEVCPESAIKIIADYPEVDRKKCVGCAECIAMCPSYALQIQWDSTPTEFCEKLVESAGAIMERLTNKALHINVLANIAKECDCMPIEMEPLVADIGILIGLDPVAIDVASCDLVNRASRPGSKKSNANKPLLDEIYPHLPWRHVLDYAEEIGIGTKNYRLVNIP